MGSCADAVDDSAGAFFFLVKKGIELVAEGCYNCDCREAIGVGYCIEQVKSLTAK